MPAAAFIRRVNRRAFCRKGLFTARPVLATWLLRQLQCTVLATGATLTAHALATVAPPDS